MRSLHPRTASHKSVLQKKYLQPFLLDFSLVFPILPLFIICRYVYFLGISNNIHCQFDFSFVEVFNLISTQRTLLATQFIFFDEELRLGFLLSHFWDYFRLVNVFSYLATLSKQCYGRFLPFEVSAKKLESIGCINADSPHRYRFRYMNLNVFYIYSKFSTKTSIG